MPDLFQISRVLGLTGLGFVISFALTPIWIHFLYKYRLGKQIRAEGAPIFNQLHQKKEGTPTMGGLLIWLTVLILALIFWGLSRLGFDSIISKFNFLNRSETLLPLGALVASALVGIADDLLGIFRVGPNGGGLKMRHRLLIYTSVAAFGAWWFYAKLSWSVIHIPFIGNFDIGLWYVLIFIFVLVSTSFSVNETDGLDGLAGGTLLTAFGAFGVIAYSQGHYNLAAFCGIIIGGLLSFLWFNIYPARFIMGDTGAMSLGITLAIIAMLTNQFLILPLIGFILVLESGSVIIQTLSKKFRRGKKIFLSAPIHHHLEAKGWPEAKITVRFWIVSWVMAGLGLIIVFLDRFYM